MLKSLLRLLMDINLLDVVTRSAWIGRCEHTTIDSADACAHQLSFLPTIREPAGAEKMFAACVPDSSYRLRDAVGTVMRAP